LALHAPIHQTSLGYVIKSPGRQGLVAKVLYLVGFEEVEELVEEASGTGLLTRNCNPVPS